MWPNDDDDDNGEDDNDELTVSVMVMVIVMTMLIIHVSFQGRSSFKQGRELDDTVCIYGQLPFLRTPSALCISILNSKYVVVGIYFSQMCNIFLTGRLAAVRVIEVSIIARCPQGES